MIVFTLWVYMQGWSGDMSAYPLTSPGEKDFRGWTKHV